MARRRNPKAASSARGRRNPKAAPGGGGRKNLKAVQAAKARKKRRNRRKKRAIIMAVEIVILLILLGATYVMAKYDKFQTVSIDSEDILINEGVEMDGYTTVALFGGDSREGQLEAGTHADTIIIAAVDHEHKEIRLASIYRDTLLEQVDKTYHKANHAYFEGGPEDAINMLNKNLDLAIEDYATVDFKALADVVDLLGGIEIDVTEPEAKMLNKYVEETAKASKKKAHKLDGAGTYNLDGPQAVTYARLRKLEGGDYKRTERQRLVIDKIFKKAKTMDLKTLDKIVDTVFPQVSTSFSLKEIAQLASAGLTYELKDSTGFPFDKNDSVRYQSAGSVVVALGLAENVRDLHEFLFPHEEDYAVSEAVQWISDNIAYITGVVRPAELDAEREAQEADSTGETDGTENTDSSDAEGASADENSGYTDEGDSPS